MIKKQTISIIAAIGEKRELGKDNKLLWHIPEDLRRFKVLTKGHAVIMGRKTYESIGKPLPDRLNIIITRDTSYTVQGAVVVHSLQEAMQNTESRIKPCLPAGRNSELPAEIFIIGGGQIYKEALPVADTLYLTIVQGSFQADTYFPDYSAFTKVISKETKTSEEYTYTFLELRK